MASTAYVPVLTLKNGHSDTVNVVAFSPEGQYLASGGDDHAVIIWDILEGEQVLRLPFESTVDTLVWHPVQKDTIIVGCSSGALQQVCYLNLLRCETYDVHLGVRSHIYSLDYGSATSCLAVAIGPGVYVARESQPNRYTGTVRLPPPIAGSKAEDSRDRAVALRFERSGTRLVVSYLTHGIICWDVHARRSLWRITPPEIYPAIGHSAINKKFRFIAVHNFKDGVHLYSLGAEQKPLRHYKFDVEPIPDVLLQVSFIHGGQAIVCGTTTGNVCIWQTTTGELYQTLAHQGKLYA
ncbi:WD40-repeat-containing domain protein [Rhodofomes roseus]|uniref:WD40-repeat-containing domain protein n=1 Tax=Rhodofomes roseus TaxID=34475 RepID=A0ABQ8KSM3_9APHY|nr:WD40-repeat-containing domain protein [Rhodofomes roseus]KAH9840939.1 WD40-repeat-containing domain protein [Rhodofomes roseus]